MRSSIFGILVVAGLTTAPAILAQRFTDAPAVRIDGGSIAGVVIDGARAYRGVPYAAPPVGQLRWKPPQPVVAWSGVKSGAEVGPACPQLARAGESIFPDPQEPQNEDCLYLNVWTAAGPGERRPVMVWYHGGGWVRGSGTSYTPSGAPIAKKGVVLVTVNYRMGALGFLAHPALTAESPHGSSGNYGFLDQIAALRWVKKNIAAFGGDPGRVTVIGESAGSWTTSLLVASPLARGLFHRAVGQSGARFGPQAYLKESRPGMPSAEQVGLDFAEAAGVDSLEALRALPVEKILPLQFRTAENVDGWFLPDQMRTLYTEGKQAMVPVIVGSNGDETTPDTARAPKTIEEYRASLAKEYGEMAGEVEKVYPAATAADIPKALAALSGHSRFTVHMRTWARMMTAAGQKAFFYQFTHEPPHPGSRERMLGAFHTGEVPYVFNHLNQRNWTPGERDVRLADAMSTYWARFATTGDPNGLGLPSWKAYDVEDERYMEFSTAGPRPGQHPLTAQLDVIDRLAHRRSSSQ